MSANIYSAVFEYDPGDPPGWGAAVAEVGRAAGGREIAVRHFELPPGVHLCPYHYEYIEEWIVVVEGSVEVRLPDGWHALERGTVHCFPAGPAGAHQVSNRNGGAVARVMMFSRIVSPGVAVYPDSDKLAVYNDDVEIDAVRVRRSDPSSHLDYWDGETA